MTYSDNPSSCGEAPVDTGELINDYQREIELLTQRVLQGASVSHDEASRLDRWEPGSYVHRFEDIGTVFGEPTNAHRRDARYSYQLPNGRIEPAHLFVHVPESLQTGEVTDRAWFRTGILHPSRASMVYGVRSDEGLSEMGADRGAEPLDYDESTQDLSIEAFNASTAEAMSTTINGLYRLVHMLRDDSKIVQYSGR